MENLIHKIVTLLNADETLIKPYHKKNKSRKKAFELKKRMYLWKAEKNYLQINFELYLIGKEALHHEFKKEYSNFHIKTGKKVYVIFKKNKYLLKHLSQMKIEDWTKVKMKDKLQIISRIKEVLNGTRTYSEEDLSTLNHILKIPQQEIAAERAYETSHRFEENHVTWPTTNEVLEMARNMSIEDFWNWNPSEEDGPDRLGSD